MVEESNLKEKEKPKSAKTVFSLIKSTVIRAVSNAKRTVLGSFLSRKKESITKLIKTELLNKINLDEKHLNDIFSSASVENGNHKPEVKKIKFKSILIANRGEIALRIVRACRELGIKPYIIYASQDKESLAVKFSEKAFGIGKSGINYLDPKKIIKIAKKAKVDAIHPGYGFLSENPKFAEMCEQNKIKFIGPSSKVISLLGDKVKAREVMHDAGIPIIGGTKRALKDANDALDIANKLGYPVILKAAAGGGGKGVRIVNAPEELPKAFESAQQEAQNAFADSNLYIEKYIVCPRHIEFQILGDKYGNVIHLGERECSIQRKYQKLIEEAPSIVLTPELRKQMGDIAVKIASLVGYEGAGTIEFLLDKNGKFFFIEMNTRIQVEHGITEMVTGLDLVKEQIKIAAGVRMGFKQDEIKILGHAIECRINAESPRNNFSPSIGKITNYLPPGGPGIRVCSSCHQGQEVSPDYDSMVAKLMCYGKNRKEAIARMKRSLDEYIIEGIETTIDLHKQILTEEDFIEGNLDTHFIESHNIIEKLGKPKKERKKSPTKDEKMLIITTAVSKYLENKEANNSSPAKVSSWVMAGRQEMVNEGNL